MAKKFQLNRLKVGDMFYFIYDDYGVKDFAKLQVDKIQYSKEGVYCHNLLSCKVIKVYLDGQLNFSTVADSYRHEIYLDEVNQGEKYFYLTEKEKFFKQLKGYIVKEIKDIIKQRVDLTKKTCNLQARFNKLIKKEKVAVEAFKDFTGLEI